MLRRTESNRFVPELTYLVYSHTKKGQVGLAIHDDRLFVVQISGDNSVKLDDHTASNLASQISNLLRLGYRAMPARMYLQAETLNSHLVGSFVKRSPELNPMGSEVIVFTPVTSAFVPSELTLSFENQLALTTVSEFALHKWLEALRNAKGYVVATATHPALALVLADWVITNKRPLMSHRDGVPLQTPRLAPERWKVWLSHFFPKLRDIETAFNDLGFDTAQGLPPPIATSDGAEPSPWDQFTNLNF